MKTKTLQLYEFHELSKEAQAKAIDKLRDINVDYHWSEVSQWEQKDYLEKYGFTDCEILFSGFWSQGDGACFTGRLDTTGLLTFLMESKTLAKYPTLVRALKKGTIYVNIKITHTDRYYHENSTTIDDYTEMQDNSELPAKLRKEYDAWYATFDARGPRNESIGWYYDTCRRFYKELEDEYEYRTMDNAVIDTINANEYTFLENGTVENA